MFDTIRCKWNEWIENRKREARLESERKSNRGKEQQLILHALVEGGRLSTLECVEFTRLPFSFRIEEQLIYAFFDVTYSVGLASVQREALGRFGKREDADDAPELTSGNHLSGANGYLAITSERVYFCGSGGGGLRLEYDGLVSVLEKGKKELVVTFDDDSPSGNRWLGRFVFDEQDARFASILMRVVPSWNPKPAEQPLGFTKSS